MTEMDKNETLINIYLDLSKAFDTLDQQILLKQMEHYGVRDTSFNLFQNYLINRKQYVEYDDIKSNNLYEDLWVASPASQIETHLILPYSHTHHL